MEAQMWRIYEDGLYDLVLLRIIQRQGAYYKQVNMIYEKALRELSTVFPKLSIKPPTQKSTVRSLIQQRECPQFTNSDFAMLRNPDSASKPLAKLTSLLSAWLHVIQHNEKARQQQEAKPLSLNQVQNIQYILAECAQVGSKSQFIYFIRQRAVEFYNNNQSPISLKDYKEIYICKEIQFYKTVTTIPQEEYFKQLEELGEKLGIMEQLAKTASQNDHHLEEFHTMLQGDELFRKKDNSLSRVINYNLLRAASLADSIEKMRKLYYHYQESLTYSLARCYYLLYLCRQDIFHNRDNEQYLDQIERFICERPEKVFVKLYHRKICKSLVLLEQIRLELTTKPYLRPLPSQQQSQIDTRISSIRQKIHIHASKPLSEQLFLQLFQQIELLIIDIRVHLNYLPQDQQIIKYLREAYQFQGQVVRMFTLGKGDRKILSAENSRLSGRSVYSGRRLNYNDAHNSIRNTMNSKINALYGNSEVDRGQDIFFYYPSSLEVLPEKAKQRIQYLSKNNQQFDVQCKKYLSRIEPDFGQCLEDKINFNPEELTILIQSGSMSQSVSPEREILMMLNRSLIKTEISQENMTKIFKPKLRFFVLKTLSQKLLELGYKNAKVLDNPQFNTLPINVQKFVETRNSFLKTVNKQIQKIIDIAALLQKLQIKQKFNVCSSQTYETFLKVLLADKQVRAYQLQFKDEKNIPKAAGFFINNKVYGPFLESIDRLLPPPYDQPDQIVDVLDDLQFFTDFTKETEQIIIRNIEQMDQEKDKKEMENICRDLGKSLSKWAEMAQEKIRQKKKGLEYEKAEFQIEKIKQIIKACNNQDRPQIKEPTARKIVKLLSNQ